MSAPPILDVHTPTSSFAIVHSITQDSLQSLYDKLSRKAHTDYHGARVGPGWLKYEWNDTVWNLDDDSDYTIFVWRKQQVPAVVVDPDHSLSPDPNALSSIPTPTLHLHDPSRPLPVSPDYRNPSYYAFRPAPAVPNHSSRPASMKSRKTKGSKRASTKGRHAEDELNDGVPQFKKEFERFRGENGVRTVIGSIGPVQNVRMLLKAGYRHVYISRKFALQHGFIPADAAPGHYGYGGLVNIGTWPITITPSPSFNSAPNSKSRHPLKPKPSMMQVYLSEEPHFDVVLGRSFFERRQVQTNPTDPTDVVCLDTGERLECELVILKDGRGEIVTVT
jgi:hypothetical protein